MKIKLTLAALLLTLNLNNAFSQAIAISTGFDNYAGTIATMPAGWYLSWNTSNSFYTSSLNYGVSSPSYKFGNDSDFVATPGYPNMDSVSFFIRGNGAPFSPLNELQIWTSEDSVVWNMSTYLDNLPTTGTTRTVPLPSGTFYIKFLYRKATAGGNLAFDDVKIYSNAVIGVPEHLTADNISIYPTPTTGNVTVSTRQSFSTKTSVSVYDLLGNKIQARIRKVKSNQFAIDLSGQRQGFYFVRIQNDQSVVTKRITLLSDSN
jgi:hypothetical protein